MEMVRDETEKRYFIEVVSKALDLLQVIETSELDLTFTELCTRLQIGRSSVFRLLYTLEKKGLVERTGKKYRRVRRKKRYLIGYGMINSEFPFSHDVSRGLYAAARCHGVDLLALDNCFNGDVALMNVKTFISQEVDFVIECQAVEAVSPVIAHLLAEAKIPSLAIDIPQPGATFFGGDSYRAGLIAGRALGDAARTRWKAKVDKVILLECSDAGPKLYARMSGALSGIEEILGPIPRSDVLHIDSRGTLSESCQIMCGLLHSIPPGRRILIAAFNDPSAVGAIRALESLQRTGDALVVGQNATQEARAELRKPESCLLGSVGYFPDKYGEQIMPIVIRILEGGLPPLAVYVQHVLVTRDNVDQFYPRNAERDGETDLRLASESLFERRDVSPAAVPTD